MCYYSRAIFFLTRFAGQITDTEPSISGRYGIRKTHDRWWKTRRFFHTTGSYFKYDNLPTVRESRVGRRYVIAIRFPAVRCREASARDRWREGKIHPPRRDRVDIIADRRSLFYCEALGNPDKKTRVNKQRKDTLYLLKASNLMQSFFHVFSFDELSHK